MRFHVAQQRGLSNAHSPFRVVEQLRDKLKLDAELTVWSGAYAVPDEDSRLDLIITIYEPDPQEWVNYRKRR